MDDNVTIEEQPTLALNLMDGNVSVAEQQNYSQRLIAAGEQLQQRADGLADAMANETNRPVIEKLTDDEPPSNIEDTSLMLPPHTIEPTTWKL